MSACTSSIQKPADGPVRVAFALSDEDTKTVLEPGSGFFSWETDDRIAVWAYDASGSSVLESQPFTLLARGNSNRRAYFTSVLPSAMTEGDYSYYLAYPYPESISGTTAVFTLPSVQDGKASGGTGICVSDRVAAGALQPFDETAPVDQTLSFNAGLRHILHYLRFYVPEGCNILGEPIKSIEFTMPQPTAGEVHVNVLDRSASLSGGGNKIKLDLEERLAENEFAAAGIFPPQSTYAEGDYMNIRVFSENAYSDLEPISLAGRNFQAGHITSVPMRITSIGIYNIYFSFVSNNLGEEVQKITVSLPSPITSDGVSRRDFVFSHEDGSAISLGETFRISTIEAAEFAALSSLSASVTYESENAIVSETINFPAFGQSDTSCSFTLNCPYLLFEDFSTLEAFSSNDDYKISSTGNKDGVKLTNVANVANGWTAARAGGEARTAIRLAARRESVARYPARCDSPQLTGIKKGHNVSLKLSFDYSMDRQELGSSKVGQTVYVGWTTETGALSSSSESGTFPASFYINETAGSYTNIDKTYELVLNDMDSSKRLSIRTNTEFNLSPNNSTCWLYIDNIKVTITK